MSEIEVKALNGLAERMAKLPKADRGISWELRNWHGHEQLTVYGQSANVCKWLLDNSEAILSALSTPPAVPARGEGWQTIDTAPKGRKLVLLDCEYWLNPVIGYFSETINSWLEYGTRDTKANAATHWVHLPARVALSASPSPVDSRDGLIERLQQIHDEQRSILGQMLLDRSEEGQRASNWQGGKVNGIASAIAALAAKEQQP